MTVFYVVLALVIAQRGGELLLARANTARLLRQGAVEVDRAGKILGEHGTNAQNVWRVHRR